MSKGSGLVTFAYPCSQQKGTGGKYHLEKGVVGHMGRLLVRMQGWYRFLTLVFCIGAGYGVEKKTRVARSGDI